MSANDANIINLEKLARFKNKMLQEVTQEEYKQLTPQQKADVTFFIKDSSAYSQPEASAVSFDNTDTSFVSDNVQDAISEISLANIFNLVYPVGSIYMSTVNTNPGTLFGGTWIAWGSGRVPVGVDANDTAFDTVEETGGSKSQSYTPAGSNAAVKLTAAQSGVPAHAHGLNSHKHSVGAHSHGLNSHTHSYVKANTTTGGTAITVDQMPSHTHLTVNNAAGTKNALTANNTVGFYAVSGDTDLPYSLRAGSGGANVSKSSATGGSNTHNHSVGNTSTSTTAATGSTADSTAFDSGAASGNTANNTAAAASESHNHTFTGTEATISHLQPYITCYMWKRTA